MNSKKRIVESALLHRPAHADVFEIGTAPGFLIVLFGGSGLDEDEYIYRSKTVIPVFDRVLGEFERRMPNSFVLVHVSAPFDVPFRRFATDVEGASLWRKHVISELLQPWASLRFVVCGFSGGAALALNGLQQDPRCFCGAVFGGDAIPQGFQVPDHWCGPLRIYEAPDDRVCNHPANQQITDALVARGVAQRFRVARGAHRLSDYATIDSLGDLLSFAAESAVA